MKNASDFKLLDRKAVDVILKMKEKNSFFRALSFWVGFRTASVEYDVQERTVGESKWSTKSLIRYAINNIVAFSDLPLQIITVMGLVMLVAAFFYGISLIVRLMMGTPPAQMTGFIFLFLVSSAFIMIGLGIVGYYIARIFEEVKDRPRYIVKQTCGIVKEITDI